MTSPALDGRTLKIHGFAYWVTSSAWGQGGGKVCLRIRNTLRDGSLEPELCILVVWIACSTAGEVASEHHLGMAMARGGTEPALSDLPVRGHAVAARMQRAESKHGAGMALGSGFLEQIQCGGSGGRSAAAVEHHLRERDLGVRQAGISLPCEPDACCLEVGGARFIDDDADSRNRGAGGLGLAPFFAPQADQGGLVATHDYPGIRTANKAAANRAKSPT